MLILHHHDDPLIFHASENDRTTFCGQTVSEDGENALAGWCSPDFENEGIPDDALIAFCLPCGMGCLADGMPIDAVVAAVVVEPGINPNLN